MSSRSPELRSPGPRTGRARAYDAVAWCYDELARFYSRDRIAEAKRAHLDSVQPGDRVLYAGVGRGAEAIEAASRGACVTGLDRSPAMLARLERGLSQRGVSAEILHADLLTHEPSQSYDAVALHFVLNVFLEVESARILGKAASWLRPGGLLFVADFAPAPGGRGRWASWAHYAPVAAAGWVLGLAPLHPIHDYAEIAERDCSGLSQVERRRFPIRRGGSAGYEFLALRRA